MRPPTILVFQAGGPTPVINATLSGFVKGFAGQKVRLLGVRRNFEARTANDLVDLTDLIGMDNFKLERTPGAVLGSSRAPVNNIALSAMMDLVNCTRACAVMGIGGNGTMSALSALGEQTTNTGQPLFVLGLPKTVDNDIHTVHVAPGYGSAARFVAISVRDFDCDFRSMATFDQVTVLETMGRKSGWVAAAGGLLANDQNAPHMILVPEVAVELDDLLQRISKIHSREGRVFIVANEVLFTASGQILGAGEQELHADKLGRTMYSLATGIGHYLGGKIHQQLGLQTRVLRPGNLGRAMTTSVSPVDRSFALRCGVFGANLVLDRIGRSSSEYLAVDEELEITPNALSDLPKGSAPLPEKYYDAERLDVTQSFKKFGRKICRRCAPSF